MMKTRSLRKELKQMNTEENQHSFSYKLVQSRLLHQSWTIVTDRSHQSRWMLNVIIIQEKCIRLVQNLKVIEFNIETTTVTVKQFQETHSKELSSTGIHCKKPSSIHLSATNNSSSSHRNQCTERTDRNPKQTIVIGISQVLQVYSIPGLNALDFFLGFSRLQNVPRWIQKYKCQIECMQHAYTKSVDFEKHLKSNETTFSISSATQPR